jgi:hypothetical protein
MSSRIAIYFLELWVTQTLSSLPISVAWRLLTDGVTTQKTVGSVWNVCVRLGQGSAMSCVVSRCCDPVAWTWNYIYLHIHLGSVSWLRSRLVNNGVKAQQVTVMKQMRIGFWNEGDAWNILVVVHSRVLEEINVVITWQDEINSIWGSHSCE